jgi:hypothetical protein
VVEILDFRVKPLRHPTTEHRQESRLSGEIQVSTYISIYLLTLKRKINIRQNKEKGKKEARLTLRDH